MFTNLLIKNYFNKIITEIIILKRYIVICGKRSSVYYPFPDTEMFNLSRAKAIHKDQQSVGGGVVVKTMYHIM